MFENENIKPVNQHFNYLGIHLRKKELPFEIGFKSDQWELSLNFSFLLPIF
jgi:hypothetical protein